MAGLVALILGRGGFGAWAALAPLASAVVAAGTFQVDTSRKTVQHQDGGSIAERLVREGDRVQVGQLLVCLDDVEARSAFDVLEHQSLALLAHAARLTAKRDQVDAISWPAALEGRRDRPDVLRLMQGQGSIFRSRRQAPGGQVDIVNRRIAQHRAEVAALGAQLAAGATQRALFDEELVNVRALVANGLERRPRLLALEREAACFEGARGEYRGRIAGAREAIAEAELQISELGAARLEEVVAELRDVEIRRAEVEQKLPAAGAQLVRREVRAPATGTVLNLRYVTPGGVIPAGGAILDIVPAQDQLVIDAEVRPLDIDAMRPGLRAQVVLSAFKGRTTPHLDGVVVRVSADALTDERTGVAYFVARVEVDRAQLSRLDGIEPAPGMPVEVLIMDGARTVLGYLLQPIRDSFRRAWRER